MIKTISTRSCNDLLYSKSFSLWSKKNKFVKLTNTNSVDYLLYIIKNLNGWVVNSDEDFFVSEESAIDDLISKMQCEDFVVAGMPDRGIAPIRKFGEFVLNPFFNIFFVDAIKAKLHEYDDKVRYGHMLAKKPCYHGGLATIDYYEPFSNFFYWLECNFKVMPLTDVATTDGVNSIIMMENRMLGVHSWYGRCYAKGCGLSHESGCHPCRIDRCFSMAIKK